MNWFVFDKISVSGNLVCFFLPFTWRILHHRCTILSILIKFKTTRPRAYLLPNWKLLFTMFPSLYHHEIFRSYYQWQRCPCKRSRSKVKVTEVESQFSCFRTITPVWIHMWWWNDAQSLMLLWRGALLLCKVIPQISRSHGKKNCVFWSKLCA